MNTLVILSSILGDQSHSSRLAYRAIERIRQADPAARITVRDLGAEPVPYFDAATAGALFTAPEARTEAQREIVALSDALVAELSAAERVVIAVPVYNFGLPAQLKSYFDLVARAGVTFRYTPEGVPEGLLRDKRVVVLYARGGVAAGTPVDSITPYLRTFLGFLGMDDIEFVAAEGIKMGEEAQRQGLDRAAARVDALFPAAGSLQAA